MPTEQELLDLIADLKSHLDFCGWGDAYERSGSHVEELQRRVNEVLPPEPTPVPKPCVMDEFSRFPAVGCPHCAKPFRRLHDMRQHIRDQHGIRVKVSDLAKQLGKLAEDPEDFD